MILSTQTDLTAKEFGIVKAIEMIAEAGFDALDLSLFDGPENEWAYSDDFEKMIPAIKNSLKANGIYFNQAHAPFPTMRENDEEFNKARIPMVKRAIEISGMLGVKNIIVHPVYFSKDKKERNMRMYNSLLPDAKKANVKIALENMWGRDNRRGVICKNVCSDAEELSDYVDSLDPEWFTVCLDIGHVGLVGDYEKDTILKLGSKRLTCVHIHDNDYRNDSHNAPFTLKLPWDEIAEAFASIGYKGDLTLEADNFLAPLPAALYRSGLKFMHDSGRYLIEMIENYKKEGIV